jgi:hypothetical protein
MYLEWYFFISNYSEDFYFIFQFFVGKVTWMVGELAFKSLLCNTDKYRKLIQGPAVACGKIQLLAYFYNF